MSHTRQILCLSIFVAALVSPAAVDAAQYYVATTGDDNNTGTQARPWKTIQHALDKMVAGDTTHVRGGTYEQDGILRFKRSGTERAPISLVNYQNERPKIYFKQPRNGMVMIAGGSGLESLVPIGWITIEGFEITNGIYGFRVDNAHDVTFRRNLIHDITGQGILGIAKNVLIEGNVIARVGKLYLDNCHKIEFHGGGNACNKLHGIYGTGTKWTITNNLIYDNLANGVQIAAYPWCADGNCYGGGARTKADPSYAGASNWLVANNTIAYNNYGQGVVLWLGGATNSKIINNIFYENSQRWGAATPQGIDFVSSGGGHVIERNLFYATAPGAMQAIESGMTNKYTESGNIVNVSPPLFVNAPATVPASPNFRLTATSPAINRGVAVLGVTTDHVGAMRPFGGGFDIGAYEFGGVPVVEHIPAAPKNLSVQ